VGRSNVVDGNSRNLSKAGWSFGWVSAIDSNGRTIWIVDAHRDGKCFIVRADEMLTALVELESALNHSCLETAEIFC